MAYSAFKHSPMKRWDSTPGACLSGSQITYLSPVADTTRISDEMELHYENGMCPNVGDIVRYSRITGAMTLADAEYQIEPGSERLLAQPEWTFIDLTGCHIAPGDLTVVMEIPEHDLFATDSITLIRDRDTYCDNSEMIIHNYMNAY